MWSTGAALLRLKPRRKHRALQRASSKAKAPLKLQLLRRCLQQKYKPMQGAVAKAEAMSNQQLSLRKRRRLDLREFLSGAKLVLVPPQRQFPDSVCQMPTMTMTRQGRS
jgi:hypothetical protein